MKLTGDGKTTMNHFRPCAAPSYVSREETSECGQGLLFKYCACGGRKIPGSNLCRRCTNRLTPIQRLFAKSSRMPNGCIEYTGTKTKNGTMRQISFNGKMVPASRLSWMLQNGEIPEGKFVCHKCDYPPCVNIEHLFLGSPQQNTLDASRKFRLTHGEAHHAHKLTEIQVLDMRKMYATGTETYASLGRKFKINECTAARIIKGKFWKHLLR